MKATTILLRSALCFCLAATAGLTGCDSAPTHQSTAQAVPAGPRFPTWKKIKIGTYPSVTALEHDKNFRLTAPQARTIAELLPKVPVASATQEIDLVNVSVGDLGFPDGATLRQIYLQAKKFGLDVLPAEAALQLRLQYTDEPEGEWLSVATAPIIDNDGHQYLFDVHHHKRGPKEDGEPKLGANIAADYRLWDAPFRFVFAQQK